MSLVEDDKKKELLEAKMREFIAKEYRVESLTETSLVVVNEKPVNHVFHFIMFLATSTFWWPVWLYVTLKNRGKRQLITVNETGDIEIVEVKR